MADYARGNSWPGGVRRPLLQSEHDDWNSRNYPGTRQLCDQCGEDTDRCEDDSLFVGDIGPLCRGCFDALDEEEQPNG